MGKLKIFNSLCHWLKYIFVINGKRLHAEWATACSLLMILQSKLRVITHLIHSKCHHKTKDKSNCIRLDLKEHTNLRSYKDYSSHKLIYHEINKCLIKKSERTSYAGAKYQSTRTLPYNWTYHPLYAICISEISTVTYASMTQVSLSFSGLRD